VFYLYSEVLFYGFNFTVGEQLQKKKKIQALFCCLSGEFPQETKSDTGPDIRINALNLFRINHMYIMLLALATVSHIIIFPFVVVTVINK
jgi:hypothetical protein